MNKSSRHSGDHAASSASPFAVPASTGEDGRHIAVTVSVVPAEDAPPKRGAKRGVARGAAPSNGVFLLAAVALAAFLALTCVLIQMHRGDGPSPAAVEGSGCGGTTLSDKGDGTAYETSSFEEVADEELHSDSADGGLVEDKEQEGMTSDEKEVEEGPREEEGLAKEELPSDDSADITQMGEAEAEALQLIAGTVDVRDEQGSTPLSRASTNGWVGMVKALLGYGADANANDNGGQTPLHWASTNGHVDVVEALLAHGAEVNAKNTRGATPLHWASANGRVNAVKALLAQGADPNAKNNHSRTPLHGASIEGRIDVVEALLARGADANARTDGSATCLHWAGVGGRADVVEALLARGADVNTKDYTGDTPLHRASSRHGRAGAAKALLANGADVNAKDRNGDTPLHRASEWGYADVIGLLKGAEGT